MFWDYAESIIQLTSTVVMLLACIYQYFSSKRRGWLLCGGVFLFGMVSCYFWMASLFFDAEIPGIVTYLGWNISYPLMAALLLYLKTPEERRYFHPLMLLPVPLNLYQLIGLYLQYSEGTLSVLNNIWQTGITTVIACLGLQSILWYRKKNPADKSMLYIGLSALLYVFFEYGMWTASCFYEPVYDLYYLSSILVSADYLFIVWSLAHYYGSRQDNTPVGVNGEKGSKTGQESRRNNLVIPLLIIIVLMVGMIFYTSQVINRVTVVNIREVGEDKISTVSARLENYMDTTKSVVWVAADTVDHMVRNGISTEQMQEYIVEETTAVKDRFDENYTGLYGYVQGVYLDGLNWVPPEGYEPTERPWYSEALEAGGDIRIVSPYVDAQTGDVVITICRMLPTASRLPDGKSRENVVAIDMTLNRIQDMIGELRIQEKGYGLIVNKDGMIIAHAEEEKKGTYLTDSDEHREFMEKTLETRDGSFEMTAGGVQRTVFVHQVLDQWYVAIVINNTELYADNMQQLTVNVVIYSVILGLIALFYYLGHKNEQLFSRRMEEMKMEEQRQAYETRVLKLEKEAADRANQAKSNFLAEMSHEIRTPINAVLGMNEMIMRESASAREAAETPGRDAADALTHISQYAGNIENAGNNLLSIINDILDVSKIEAGRMEIVDAPYELSSLLNDVVGLVSFKARDKGLDFLLDVDESIPNGLYGDKVRVRQVLTNLLSNAVKYTERGSIQMRIRCPESSFRTGMLITLKIVIRDTGIGIRETDIPKLFGKFQRVDLEKNSTVEGTGLGLSITGSLLEMMGGRISVESRYGEGSAFTVLLPQKVVSCAPVGSIQAADAGGRPDERNWHEMFRAPEARILVVDDTRMNVTVAVGLLQPTQIRIDAAMSGPEAVRLAEENDYDLILMDQRMPGMDGTEALRRIRKLPNEKNRKTPVICLTADAIIGARERYVDEGFTDYLPKPVGGNALEKCLLKYLPPEKVKPAEKTDKPSLVPQDSDFYTTLRTAGIRPETGLGYCRHDGTLYQSMLREYALSAAEKMRQAQQFMEEQDWKQYGILVHSLKSTSEMIGASDLSEEAARMEEAAAREDGNAIGKAHPGMAACWLAVAEAAARAAGVSGETAPDPDEDILEFPPIG